MVIAGWILFGIGSFFSVMGLASEIYEMFGMFLTFVLIPGIIFLSVGYSIRRRREENRYTNFNAGNYNNNNYNNTNALNSMSDTNTQQEPSSKVTYFVCPDCGYQVFEDYKCCPHCGVELNFEEEKGKFCSGCGKELSDEHAFCPYCGKKR